MTSSTPSSAGAANTAQVRTSPEFVERLLAAAEAMKAELDNLREQADARQYHLEQVGREIALAARLQRDFLPRKLPEVGCLRFHVAHRAASGVSGDMYGIDRLDEAHVGLHLIDAVGHGMPAALLSMFLHHAVRPKIVGDRGYELLAPGEVMSRLNSSLCGQSLSNGFFATALYAKLNAETGVVEVGRGGHPLPLLVREGRVFPVPCDGALLGIIPDETFEVGRVDMREGDKLVFCTDGAEALFASDGGPGDTDTWTSGIQARASLSAKALAADVLGRIGDPPADDVTVVVVEHL